MALSEKALCTVADVETEIGASTTTATTEAQIEDASEMIADYLGRVVYAREDIEEKVAGDGSPFMTLSSAPIIELTSISFDGSDVDSDNYEIHDAEAGIIYFIGEPTVDTNYRGVGVSRPRVPGTGRKSYLVTYSAGWVTTVQSALIGNDFVSETVTLPRAIRRACIELVVSLIRGAGRDPNVKAEALTTYSVTYRDADGSADPEGSGLPASVAAKLRPFRFARQG